MANNYFFVKNGINIVPAATSVSAKGDIAYNTSTDKLELYNGAVDPLVNEAKAATLTNKTLTTPTINGAALSGTLSGTPTFSGILNVTPAATGTIATIRSSTSGTQVQAIVGHSTANADLTLRVLATGDSFITSDTGRYLALGDAATERFKIASGGAITYTVSMAGPTLNATSTTDSSSTSTGAIVTAGGIGVAKNIYVGGTTGIVLAEGTALNWNGTNNLIYGSNTSNYVRIRTNGTDAILVDSSQNSNFTGTVTSAKNLILSSGTTDQNRLILQNGGTTRAQVGIATAGGDIITGSLTNELAIRTNSTKLLVSTNNGASTSLHIDTASNVTSTGTNDTTAVTHLIRTSGSTGQAYFATEGSSAGTVASGTLAYAAVFGGASGSTTTQLASSGVVRATILSTGEFGIGTSTPGFLLDVAKSSVGGLISGRVYNTDNTNSASGGRSIVAVGGSSSGDPRFVASIVGVQEYYFGIDNDDSDKLKIGLGSDVGTTPAITVDQSQNIILGPGTSNDPFSRGNSTNVAVNATGTSAGFNVRSNATSAEINLGLGSTLQSQWSSTSTNTDFGTATTANLRFATNGSTRLTFDGTTGDATFARTVKASSATSGLSRFIYAGSLSASVAGTSPGPAGSFTPTICSSNANGVFIITNATIGSSAIVYFYLSNALTIISQSGTEFAITASPSATQSGLQFVSSTGVLTVKNGFPGANQYIVNVLGH